MKCHNCSDAVNTEDNVSIQLATTLDWYCSIKCLLIKAMAAIS